MEINILTGQDILRDIAIQYVNKAFVYINDCNPPLSIGCNFQEVTHAIFFNLN